MYILYILKQVARKEVDAVPMWRARVHVDFVGSCNREVEVEAETEEEAADLASEEAVRFYGDGDEIDDWDSTVTVEGVEPA